MKKLIPLFLIVFVLLTALSGHVCAAETIASGTCGEYGDNVKWHLDSSGVLTISGSGKMADFSNPFELPYASVEEYVTSIVIEDGITHIGKNAFFWKNASDQGKNNVETITIPGTLQTIGDCTFAYMENVETVYYNAESCTYAGSSLNLSYGYFPQGKKLVIGKTVKNIGANVFYRANFSVVQYEGTEEEWKNVNVHYTGNEVLKDIKFSKGETPILILMNNKFIECDQPPVIKDGRTLVPMRAIFEALGATVNWDGSTQTASGVKDGKKVSFTLGDKYIDINGTKTEIDVAAQSVNNRTLIPIRAVAEAFDCEVNWNGQKRYVIIAPKGQAYRVEAINSNNEVLATAHFDDKGRMTTIYGSGCNFLSPFFVNMCGNTYIDHLGEYLYSDDAVLNFDYDETGNITFAEAICEKNGKSSSFNYIYTNGVYTQIEDNGESTDYVYIGSECLIGEPHSGYNITDTYTFNESGLLKKYKYFNGGVWERTFEYDSQGKLLKDTHNTMGLVSNTYIYDEDSKLSGCLFKPDINGPQYTYEVTYKYINE